MPSSPIESTPSEKARLRAHYRMLRKQIPTEERARLDSLLCQRVAAHPAYVQCRTLLCYFPIASEPNLLALAHHALASGKTLAFPRCDEENTTMTFCAVCDPDAMPLGAYRIPEPPADAPVLTDFDGALCLVPALAIDRQGYRLGYGKGYYDRFLSDFAGHSLCAVYHALLTPSLPVYPTDRAVDLILTEKGELDPNETHTR